MNIFIIIEEDDDARFHRSYRYKRPQNPLVDGVVCPYCGKLVYSMEVHMCFQQTCGNGFIYGENHPENGPYCWDYKENENG